MNSDILYHTVLLAEDDNDDYEFFQDAVRDTGSTELIRAYDGEQLMKMLTERQVRPDIIYLDINMPRKNGMQCLIEIRAMREYKNTPIIIMSTTQNQIIIDSFFEAGANLYISKPSVYSELKAIIEKTL